MNPHPIAFTFRSERPVYPMRLTGVENDRCDLELYVFGPERASARSLAVDYCGMPTFVNRGMTTESLQSERFRFPKAGEFLLKMPTVLRWTSRRWWLPGYMAIY